MILLCTGTILSYICDIIVHRCDIIVHWCDIIVERYDITVQCTIIQQLTDSKVSYHTR